MIGVFVYRTAWVVLTPVLMLVSAIHPRLRGDWLERWAFRFPQVEPGAVLVHGASVGEGVAARSVIRELEAQHPDQVVLRSAMTDTGLASARNGQLSHYAVCALPFDGSLTVGRWLNRVRPKMVILIESELWPNLLLGCRSRGIPVAVVGARVAAGGRNFERFIPGLFYSTVKCVSHWLIQAPVPETEWMSGVVEIIGDPKLDVEKSSPPLDFAGTLVVGASTRGSEEAYLIDSLNHLDSSVQMLLAPRHLSRLTLIEGLLNESGHTWARRSSLSHSVSLQTRVVLLDTMGELASFYTDAAAVFVGGTLTPKVGGHSPAEAVAYGANLVAGPHTWSNASAWRGVSAVTLVHPEEMAEAFLSAIGQEKQLENLPYIGSPSSKAVGILSPLIVEVKSQERLHRPMLLPMSWLFQALGHARRKLGSAMGRTVATVPVISVGAIGSGGTGKTPAVEWVLGSLQGSRKRVAVVSRGYRRASGGERVRSADVDSSSSYLGDELSMLHKKGHSVYSSPNRREGADVAVARGAELLVLDDGFQQTALHSDVDIVVVDANHPKSGGVIPAGEAREGLASLGRADVLWMNRGSATSELLERLSSGCLVVEAESKIAHVRYIKYTGGQCTENTILPYEISGRRVRAFCGIAHPGRFLEQLLNLGVRVRGWKVWPDHHSYNLDELQSILNWGSGGLLVTTEKDLARIETLAELIGDFSIAVAVMETTVVKGDRELREMISKLADSA